MNSINNNKDLHNNPESIEELESNNFEVDKLIKQRFKYYIKIYGESFINDYIQKYGINNAKSVLKKYAKSNNLNTKHKTVTFSKINEISNDINTVANAEAPPLTIEPMRRKLKIINKIIKTILPPVECNLSSMLEPYKNNDTIPIQLIDPIILQIFKSSQICHNFSNTHKVVKITVKDLLNAPITNWKYNRPADPMRCPDIARYIYNSKKPIDTLIYLSFNNQTMSFDVIDGIHRYTALKLIFDKTNNIDLNVENEFGDTNITDILYNSIILLCIRVNAVDSDLYELFKTLNKSNPIPELYIRDTPRDKKEVIESIASQWQHKYTTHFSSSLKPNKPNVNRDRFIDLLDHLYDKYKITIETKTILSKKLEIFNTNISNNISNKISQKICDKCSESGCWIFIKSIDDLKHCI
jgi:hypothetical protein